MDGLWYLFSIRDSEGMNIDWFIPGILYWVSDMLRLISKYDCTVEADRCNVSNTLDPKHCLAYRVSHCTLCTKNKNHIKFNQFKIEIFFKQI